jgi:hypothetical protein
MVGAFNKQLEDNLANQLTHNNKILLNQRYKIM